MIYLFAFLIGGALCAAAQILIDLTRLTPARILVGTVVLGVLLGALGLYEPLLKLAGCGVSVPLIGFGGNIAKGVREAVAKDGLLGVLTGPMSAAAGGLGAAMIFAFLCALLFSSKPKRMKKSTWQSGKEDG